MNTRRQDPTEPIWVTNPYTGKKIDIQPYFKMCYEIYETTHERPEDVVFNAIEFMCVCSEDRPAPQVTSADLVTLCIMHRYLKKLD